MAHIAPLAIEDVDPEIQVQVGRKDLRLITEVAITTMSSRGLKLAFEEFQHKPSMGLSYTLSYCTFPLLEDVMKAIIEAGTDPPDQLPRGLRSATSHDLRWLRAKLRAPTVFEPDVYQKFIGDVNKNVRANRPPHLSLARLQREHQLVAGYSVFDNVITAASKIWPGAKYLEAGVTMSEHVDLIPLAFDLSRWLLIEFLRYERAHSRVAASWPELNEWVLKLLHIYDQAE